MPPTGPSIRSLLSAALLVLLASCNCDQLVNGLAIRDETWTNVDCVIQTRKLAKSKILRALSYVVDGNYVLNYYGTRGDEQYSPILYRDPRFDIALSDRMEPFLVRYFADEGYTKKQQNGRPKTSPITMLAMSSILPGICLADGGDCDGRGALSKRKFLTYATSHNYDLPKAHGVLSVEDGANVGIGTTAIIDRDGEFHGAESGDDPKGIDFTVFVLQTDQDPDRHIDEIASVLALAFGEKTKSFFIPHKEDLVTRYVRINPEALPQVLAPKVRICRLP